MQNELAALRIHQSELFVFAGSALEASGSLTSWPLSPFVATLTRKSVSVDSSMLLRHTDVRSDREREVSRGVARLHSPGTAAKALQRLAHVKPQPPLLHVPRQGPAWAAWGTGERDTLRFAVDGDPFCGVPVGTWRGRREGGSSSPVAGLEGRAMKNSPSRGAAGGRGVGGAWLLASQSPLHGVGLAGGADQCRLGHHRHEGTRR